METPKKDINRLNHAEFYKLCTVLSNGYEELTRECYSRAELAEALAKRSGVRAPNTKLVGKLFEATGLPEPDYKKRPRLKTDRNNPQVVCDALVLLYKLTGECPPEALLTTQRKYRDKYGLSVVTPATPPMPVQAVPDPKTIRCVDEPKKA